MSVSLSIVFPVFALIALGWGAGRFRLTGSQSGAGISEFVLMFAIPAMLFRTLATAELPSVNPWPFWLAYFLAAALIWGLGMLAAKRLAPGPLAARTVSGFAAAQGNTVLIGIPLILSMYGEAGKTPMFLLVAVHLPIMVTAASLIVERSLGASASWPALAVKCFGHPIILAILAGALTRFLAIPLPEAAIVPLKLLGDAAPGAALFAMGLSLNLHGFGDNPRLILALSLLKLIAMPALVYALAFHWFALPPVWAGVAVLFAACPVGINSYIIAARFEIGVAETSGTITVSTLLSIFTVTAWVAILQGF